VRLPKRQSESQNALYRGQRDRVSPGGGMTSRFRGANVAQLQTMGSGTVSIGSLGAQRIGRGPGSTMKRRASGNRAQALNVMMAGVQSQGAGIGQPLAAGALLHHGGPT